MIRSTTSVRRTNPSSSQTAPMSVSLEPVAELRPPRPFGILREVEVRDELRDQQEEEEEARQPCPGLLDPRDHVVHALHRPGAAAVADSPTTKKNSVMITIRLSMKGESPITLSVIGSRSGAPGMAVSSVIPASKSAARPDPAQRSPRACRPPATTSSSVFDRPALALVRRVPFAEPRLDEPRADQTSARSRRRSSSRCRSRGSPRGRLSSCPRSSVVRDLRQHAV